MLYIVALEIKACVKVRQTFSAFCREGWTNVSAVLIIALQMVSMFLAGDQILFKYIFTDYFT